MRYGPPRSTAGCSHAFQTPTMPRGGCYVPAPRRSSSNFAGRSLSGYTCAAMQGSCRGRYDPGTYASYAADGAR
jgi:hypothetical protein